MWRDDPFQARSVRRAEPGGGSGFLGLLSFAGKTPLAPAPPDLARVERRIAREPAYRSGQPLYGLYLFGPQARTRVWAVLDRSRPRAAGYDVLYIDRDADGDLTGPGKRIEGKADGDGMTFVIGSFTDPLTGQKHTELTVTRRPGARARVMLSMKWCGRVVVRGGYAPAPGPYTQFAASPGDAPVLWPGADGPLGFQPWQLGPLPIAGTVDLRVFLGHPGCGRHTFCAVPNTFLPAKLPVLATLVYTDRDGKEWRARSELGERC
jgi:hypothetical protein